MRPTRRAPPARTDAELIKLSFRDVVAFSELYSRRAPDVYVWAVRRLEWAASDLTAETFAQALLNRERFRDEHHGSALPWLLGIAQNLIAEALRKDQIETRARQRLGLPLDLATEDGFDDVEERLSPRLALRAQFDALPPGERDALALRIVDELTYDEVADKLSIRPAAARLRVSRALRRLGATVPQEEI